MSSVAIKICGITSAGDALLCADAGADYLGFVFHPGSPRYVSPETAGSIISAMPGHVTPVGVFVNPSTEQVREAVRESGIRMIQLSGDETPSLCAGLGLPVIKVVRPPRGQPGRPGPGEYDVFAVMVDGDVPGRYGGTGTHADTEFARACAASARCFLAGGLTGENVQGLIDLVSPFAVDVSSWTESRPGVKDPSRVREFCTTVRHHRE
jgi:phosphoribosylanthranilate isomerase